jgi:hypothetical protein
VGLWLAGGGIWPCVKEGLGLGGFMAGWGWYLVLCEGGFWARVGLWLAGGFIWSCVKVGLGLGEFMAGWG